MRLATKALFGAVGLLGTLGCARLTVTDARDLLKGMEAISSASADGDQVLALLMKSCSEIPSCSGGCTRALEAAAQLGSSDPGARGPLLAQCFSDFRKQHDEKGATAEAWFVSYYRAYAGKALPLLSPSEQKQFQMDAVKVALAAPPKHALRDLADPIVAAH